MKSSIHTRIHVQKIKNVEIINPNLTLKFCSRYLEHYKLIP